jgi:hypothetical protein
MADKLALGERWWDGYEVKEKARVLYVDNEIGSYELQRRICVRHDKLGR